MTRAERRHNNVRKALRKQKLAEQLYNNSTWGDDSVPWYDNLHQYSKNKGKRRHLAKNYAPSYNPSIRDRKQIEYMDYEE